MRRGKQFVSSYHNTRTVHIIILYSFRFSPSPDPKKKLITAHVEHTNMAIKRTSIKTYLLDNKISYDTAVPTCLGLYEVTLQTIFIHYFLINKERKKKRYIQGQ